MRIGKCIDYALRHVPGTSLIPDKQYLKWLYKLRLGHKLDLSNPRTFTAKIQWLKIYDRKPHHTTMVDKAAVKDYVRAIAGDDVLIPTIGVWDKFDDIDFSTMPERFVLKTTHGGGGLDIVVVKDKAKFNPELVRDKFNKALKKSLFYHYREWPYKDVKPRIIAEPYMEDEFGELRDYKFFCMNGEPKFLFMATNRLGNGELTFDFLDLEFNRLPVTGGHPLLATKPVPPANFQGMIELARKLSAGEKFVRVDLYNIRGKIYFGEYTFYHNSGLVPFDPEEWDLRFGEMIDL